MHAKSTFTGIKQFVVLNYGRKELTSLALFLVFAKVQLKYSFIRIWWTELKFTLSKLEHSALSNIATDKN